MNRSVLDLRSREVTERLFRASAAKYFGCKSGSYKTPVNPVNETSIERSEND